MFLGTFTLFQSGNARAKIARQIWLEKKAWCGTDWLELDVWLYGRLEPKK